MAKKQKDPNKKSIWQEFKEFISRGNVLDMAVGVVIGGAFSAIVTAVVNILMSVCTWGVPGGIAGLVTVLPAANPVQAGFDPSITAANGATLGQFFAASDLQGLAEAMANTTYGESVVAANPNLIESIKSTILSKYTLHGGLYTYNLSSVIDWGTLINAVISFLIVAATLFVIVKVAAKMNKAREDMKAKVEAKKAAKDAEQAPAEEEAKAE